MLITGAPQYGHFVAFLLITIFSSNPNICEIYATAIPCFPDDVDLIFESILAVFYMLLLSIFLKPLIFQLRLTSYF